ncbi:hypothetical protein [Pseudomonas putida]|jgi:hypothetical protein|uniref:hypothetical protein n=1 Tax=Pseudomonas putida TaxID=303 RepID=UPI000CD46B7E|nr:hypothetical protein [Pseudomonas putida]POG00124.1 hypothetical protein BGP83_23610 [Pseudomonas putida]
MTPKMQLMARQLSRRERQQAPAPEVPSGVGSAIEAMIEQAVQERVAQALAEQRRQIEASRPPAPRYSSFEQLPPVPQTRAPKAIEATIQRDGAGLARSVTVNGVRYLAQRDAAGQLIRMVSEDMASEVNYNGLPVPVAKANRKLYGNEV